MRAGTQGAPVRNRSGAGGPVVPTQAAYTDMRMFARTQAFEYHMSHYVLSISRASSASPTYSPLSRRVVHDHYLQAGGLGSEIPSLIDCHCPCPEYSGSFPTGVGGN